MTRRNGRHGTKYNRRGMSGMSGMSMTSDPMRQKMVRNMRDMLEIMKYTLSSNAVLVFQRDFNIVLKFHPDMGSPVAENGSYNSETYLAMKQALTFEAGLPNSWIYYVKKYRAVSGGGAGAKPVKRARSPKSRRRRLRRA
jgi:hypothetical protein